MSGGIFKFVQINMKHLSYKNSDRPHIQIIIFLILKRNILGYYNDKFSSVVLIRTY